MLLNELTQSPVKGVKSTQQGPLVIPEDMQDIEEATLSRNELNKRNNMDVFIQKLANKEPFVGVGQTEPTIVLEPDPEALEQMRQGNIPTAFKGIDGKLYKLSQLEKTAEFGGKGTGFGTRIEDAELASLQAQLAELKGNNPEITIRVGDRDVSVADVVTTPGTPKSDFHFVDSKGNSVAWVSHKDGSAATHFGQWGGMSDREMLPVYNANPEVKAEVAQFIQDIKALVGDEMPRATTIARPASELFQMISIYGNGFGGKRGPQNVDVILQGPVTISNGQLVAPNMHSNGEPVKGAFEPAMMAMYKGDRSNFGIKGSRFSMYPIGGRKVHRQI
jgi:hypothetical protein